MRYIDYYSYYYEYRTPASPLATIISLALGVLLIVAMWMIFKKSRETRMGRYCAVLQHLCGV